MGNIQTKIHCGGSGSTSFCPSNPAEPVSDCVAFADPSSPFFILKTISIFIPLAFALYIGLKSWYGSVMQIVREDLTDSIACILLHVDVPPENSSDDVRATKARVKYRGLFEKRVVDMFPSEALREQLDRSAKVMHDESMYQCIVPLPPAHAWKFLTIVEAELNQLFSLGTMAMDMGQPVKEDMYAVCITLIQRRWSAEAIHIGKRYVPPKIPLSEYFRKIKSTISPPKLGDEVPKELKHEQLPDTTAGSRTSLKYRIFVTREENIRNPHIIRRVEAEIAYAESKNREINNRISDLQPHEVDARKKLEAELTPWAVGDQAKLGMKVLKQMRDHLFADNQKKELIRPNIPIIFPILELQNSMQTEMP